MFHTCKTPDDAKRLYSRLKPLISPDKGGEVWMVTLLDDSLNEAITKLSKLTPEKSADPSESIMMLNKILSYAESRPDFNSEFFKSIALGVERYGKMTDKQEASVRNTYEKFKLGKK